MAAKRTGSTAASAPDETFSKAMSMEKIERTGGGPKDLNENLICIILSVSG